MVDVKLSGISSFECLSIVYFHRRMVRIVLFNLINKNDFLLKLKLFSFFEAFRKFEK